jgi:hypothetical protein
VSRYLLSSIDVLQFRELFLYLVDINTGGQAMQLPAIHAKKMNRVSCHFPASIALPNLPATMVFRETQLRFYLRKARANQRRDD